MTCSLLSKSCSFERSWVFFLSLHWLELEVTIDRRRSYFIPCVSPNQNFPIYLHSEYVKIFDGNGTEVFTRHGWSSTSYKSSSLQQISFEDSKNFTIQASLINRWSYIIISYGTLKKPLHLGMKTSFAVCDVLPCPPHKMNYPLYMLVVKVVFVVQSSENVFPNWFFF